MSTREHLIVKNRVPNRIAVLHCGLCQTLVNVSSRPPHSMKRLHALQTRSPTQNTTSMMADTRKAAGKGGTVSLLRQRGYGWVRAFLQEHDTTGGGGREEHTHTSHFKSGGNPRKPVQLRICPLDWRDGSRVKSTG